MSSTPKSATEESLNESWVEVNSLQAYSSPIHQVGHGTNSSFQSMEKLLWEAQKESNQSSMVGSGRNSHSISPKSAQSPVYPLESISPIEAILLSKDDLIGRNRQLSTDWIWDWSSRANEPLSNDWALNQYQQLKKTKLSLRQWAVRRGIFSKEVLSILLLTNILSLILGAGIGYTILVRRTI